MAWFGAQSHKEALGITGFSEGVTSWRAHYVGLVTRTNLVSANEALAAIKQSDLSNLQTLVLTPLSSPND